MAPGPMSLDDESAHANPCASRALCLRVDTVDHADVNTYNAQQSLCNRHQGVDSDGHLVSVDLWSPSTLTLLERVQGAVHQELGSTGLSADIVDAQGLPVTTNAELCRAMVCSDRTPLQAIPSKASTELINQYSEELQDLRAQVVKERLVSLERKLETAIAEVAQERAARETSITSISERLEAIADLVGKVASDCAEQVVDCAKLERQALEGNGNGEIARLRQETQACEDRAKTVEARCEALISAQVASAREHESAIRTVSGDVMAVCEAHRQQILKVTEGMTELGRELSYRVERLEADAASMSHQVVDLKTGRASDAKRLDDQDEKIRAHAIETRAQGQQLSTALDAALRRLGETEASVLNTVVERLSTLADRLRDAEEEHVAAELANLLAPTAEERARLGLPPSDDEDEACCAGGILQRPTPSNNSVSNCSRRYSTGSRKEVQWCIDEGYRNVKAPVPDANLNPVEARHGLALDNDAHCMVQAQPPSANSSLIQEPRVEAVSPPTNFPLSSFEVSSLHAAGACGQAVASTPNCPKNAKCSDSALACGGPSLQSLQQDGEVPDIKAKHQIAVACEVTSHHQMVSSELPEPIEHGSTTPADGVSQYMTPGRMRPCPPLVAGWQQQGAQMRPHGPPSRHTIGAPCSSAMVQQVSGLPARAHPQVPSENGQRPTTPTPAQARFGSAHPSGSPGNRMSTMGMPPPQQQVQTSRIPRASSPTPPPMRSGSQAQSSAARAPSPPTVINSKHPPMTHSQSAASFVALPSQQGQQTTSTFTWRG